MIVRALKKQDRFARAFVDGVRGGPACLGGMPQEFAAGESVALWLTQEGVKAIRKTEREVICRRAGSGLATAIANARWRKEASRAVAESGYFAYTFAPAHDGWHLTECQMLQTARVELQAYLHIFGDFSHSPARGVLPDFYLRDLTPEEIKESGLREGAVLSVSSLVMKVMGRFYMPKTRKREKRIRATLNEWKACNADALQSVVKLKAKPEKNAWVISSGVRKRG